MKYILELEDEPNKEYFGEGNYYRCKQIPYWSISESMRDRLQPYGEIDRKTESNSEKPNNCEDCANGEGDIEACGYCRHGDLYKPKDEPTISKMEQVEDEPQTPMCETCRYDEPNNPKCDECIVGEDKPSNYEPQTDCAWR